MFTEIVSELKKLLSSKNILEEASELQKLTDKFNQLKNENTDEADVNQLLAGDLINEIKSKIKDEQVRIEKEAEKIATAKTELIEQLEVLIQNETNIGKAFGDLKVIREKWNALNEKLSFDQKSIDRTFTKLLEDFYYNIIIYKAIQEHDLKRNEQLKGTLLQKLETCSTKPASLELMTEVKTLKNEWESIGPVKKEAQDEFWNRYRSYLDIIYGNFKDFKASEKIEHQENLKKKQHIVDYIASIDLDKLKNVKDWKSKTSKVIKKQDEWKTIGFVPKEHKDNIWQAYKSACDDFFGARKVFLEEQKKVFKQNKKLKTELCKRAEELLEQEDFNELTPTFVKMQADWKKIGPVHQRDEQYLWHKFQTACNAFFNKKKSFKKHQNQEKEAVNEAKIVLIEKAKTIQGSDEEVKLLLQEWWATNKEHTKKANDLKKSFCEIIEEKTNKSFAILEADFFDEKIEIYAGFDDGGSILDLEKQHLKDKLQTVKKEIQQYENNLSFFDTSSKNNANALLTQVQEKINTLHNSVDGLKACITKINQVLNKK